MIEVETLSCKNGSSTLSVKTGTHSVKLHSAFDPEKEAERSTSDFKAAPGRLILIAGCALGYHTEILKKKISR
jgi:hypothetical protein